SVCRPPNSAAMDTSKITESSRAVRSEGSRWPCSYRHTFARSLHPNKKAKSFWPRLDRLLYVLTYVWGFDDMVVAQMNLQLRLYASQRIQRPPFKKDGRSCRKRQQTDAQRPNTAL